MDVPKSTAYVYLRTLEETDELVTVVIEETRPFRVPQESGNRSSSTSTRRGRRRVLVATGGTPTIDYGSAGSPHHACLLDGPNASVK